MIDEQQKKLIEELLSSEKERPSFAKILYFGLVDSARISPYPELKPEERAKVEELILEINKIEELDGAKIDRESEIPKSLLRKLSALGIMGMTVPKEHGGLGMSQTAYCKVMEKIAAKCNSTSLFINAHHSIGLRALILFGTEEQKKSYLRDLAEGKKWAAFSLTEPNAGSDAAGIETRAEYLENKKTYRINGFKQWTTNGSVASILTVMAKTDEKVTAFLVTPDMPGFSIRAKALEKVGMRGTKTANLGFENLEVPEKNILGPKGHGLRVCLTVLDYGRTTFGATCLGSAKFCLEKAVLHARTRKQFGRTLASFPLVKKKLARMASSIYAMESITYLIAGLLDAGASDIMLEAAILKVFNSEALWNILYDTMQIYGGRSFFTDHPFERMMRDARLNMIGEGSNEVLKAFIAVVGLREVGLQLKKAKENPKQLWKFLKSWLLKMHLKELPFELKEEAKWLNKATRRFSWEVIKLLIRFKEEIVEQQFQLERITTLVTALFTTAAVLSRISSEKKAPPEALLYLQYAQKQFEEALLSLHTHPHDENEERVADGLT